MKLRMMQAQMAVRLSFLVNPTSLAVVKGLRLVSATEASCFWSFILTVFTHLSS